MLEKLFHLQGADQRVDINIGGSAILTGNIVDLDLKDNLVTLDSGHKVIVVRIDKIVAISWVED